MVQYTRITSNPVTIQQLGQPLHSNLIAAGWTLEYANADAQIGGSGGAPGWGKTPAVDTSAGIVVYRMPASGSLKNRWYAQVEFRWAGITSSIQTRLTIAKGVNASTGALTEPGTLCGYDASAQNNNGGDCYVVAYDHGLLVAINSGSHNYFLGLERRRSLVGQYTDDAVAYGLGSAPLSSGGWTASSGSSINLARSWASGEYGSQPLAALIGVANSGTPPTPTTYNAQSNATGYPAGLFSTSGGLGGMLRLLMLWLPNDAPALGSQSVRIDGADRIYFATGSGGLQPMGCRLAVATQ